MQNILILCGGRSAEHEISVLSAKNIIKALDKEIYQPILVGITRQGVWHYYPDYQIIEQLKLIEINNNFNICTLIKYPTNSKLMIENLPAISIDTVFPILHGPQGEDGTMQGLLEIMDLPYIGNKVFGSSMTMDKGFFKQLLNYHQLPTLPFVIINQNQPSISYYHLTKQLDAEILFVKPARMGSSVGISKVYNETQYIKAVELAFKFDDKIIIEQYQKIQEVECAVLGNLQPIASVIGEIIPTHDFYSYEAKYLDTQGAKLMIPANIDLKTSTIIEQLALEVFKLFECRGLARVDFFINQEQKVFVNEINAMPGFTDVSMYPILMNKSGFNSKELITKLIDLAHQEHQNKNKFRIES